MAYKSFELAHQMLQKHLSKSAYVVDATCGNGHDSFHIASLLDKHAKLFAFDIQELAIQKTKDRLTGVSCQTFFIHDTHANLLHYLQPYIGKIDAIIFNLGYLPNAKNNVTTQVQSTISAIEQSLILLRNKGLLLIVAYPGHPNGLVEKCAIEDFLTDYHDIQIMKYANFTNKNSPILYAITKH